MDVTPKVALCSIFRDSESAGDLQPYMRQVEALDWPRECLRLYLEEGDSTDGTFQHLSAWLANTHLGAVWKQDTGAPRYASVEDEARFMHLDTIATRCRQRAIDDRWADYIWWLESDLLWEPDLLQRLIAHGVDVVAPWILANALAGGEREVEKLWALPREVRWFYDTWAYRALPSGFKFAQTAYRPKKLFKVWSAGSCLLMTMKAAQASNQVTGGAVVGWCNLARAKGFHVWVDPDTVVWHPYPK